MSNQKPSYNLIESLLSLLAVLEKDGIDAYQVLENPGQFPALSGSPNIRTACQIIRFMDEMPGGFLIYRADEDEQILYANAALIRIFRCDSREEFRALTGNSFRGMVHPEDLPAVEQSIKEQIAASQYDLDYVEYRIRTRGGQIRWIEDYGHFVRTDSVGDIFYVFLGDATEKKQENLRRLEVIEGLSANYESILYVDLNADSILPYRLSPRIRPWFTGSGHAFCFSSYMSEYLDAWVVPEERGTVALATSPDYIRQKLSKTKTYYINYQISSGRSRQYMQLRIVNVGKTESISQIVLGCRLTDDEIRREMEQNQILEEALGNANLAITAKNAFLSNMSHDMRTPLNAIFGYAGLAKQNLHIPETALAYLNRIESAGRQLLDLIEKVLEISWNEANDVPLKEKECSLPELAEEVYKAMLPQASDKSIDFSADFSRLVHRRVFCDQGKLRQILLYLTDNAVTYTPEGGHVSLSATELESLPNDYAVYQFTVEDTGIGIGQDFLGHIFEPFEREKNTTFSGIHGTGLGLTIARNIVGQMDGAIDVESKVGQGSIFTVTLRLRAYQEPSSPSCGEPVTLEELLGRTILLVEDNALNLEIETDILSELGFVIDSAENGHIAVEKLSASRPGDYLLVLMDIQMPVMDGREASMAIRRLPDSALSRIPIIALSANAFESDRRKSIESGMDAHLTKPLNVPLLLETIVKTIQKHRDSGKPAGD